MTEINDLLERVETPRVDAAADVARGRLALRRRHRFQVSGAALTVAALAAFGVAAQNASGASGAANPSYTGRTTPSTQSSAGSSPVTAPNHPPRAIDHRESHLPRPLTDPTSQQTIRHYHDVLAEHLDPGGDHLLLLAENEQGGGGSFGTKLDWRQGGLLEIVVGTRWAAAGGFYGLEEVGMTPTTYEGHPARVSTRGDDLVVSVRHADGTVVTLIASTSFGNNGTSTATLGLTHQQLLAAAADPRLRLPYYLR